MNKLSTYFLALVILVISLIALSFYKKLKDTKSYLLMEENMNAILTSNRFLEIESQKLFIIENLVIHSSNLKEENIEDLTSEGPKLILKTSELSCSDCYEKEILNLKTFAKRIGSNNILIFSKYSDHNYLLKFKRTNQVPFRIFNIPNDLITSLDTINIPYYFMINNNNEILSGFSPNRNRPSDTFKYFDIIKYQYFD